MKNAKKLSRAQKEFLKARGYDPSIHLIVKNMPDCYEFYNKITGVTFEMGREEWL